MRWWKLAGVSIAGLLILAAATWAVFWIRPPDPAHLITLAATYDNTLAVPPNAYGKAGARELADLAKPGGWLGTQSRLHGAAKPVRFTQIGLPDLSAIREKCIVISIAAHGGRDRNGAFLFAEDASADLAARVRLKTILGQLAKLPAGKQKLLILDATEPAAYTDLGLVHNDFASAVEDLDADIAAIPNLAVFMSTGADQRSWTSPEWGQTSFLHFVLRGLRGDADANGDKRISGIELVDYVSPRVKDWARDHRGALQSPVLLPRGEAGRTRVEAMHLAMTDGPPPDDSAPTPFDSPPELKQAWQEYLDLAGAYPPPTAYTPHLWRQYEAWILRYERAIIAGDAEGEKNARARSSDLKRQIEAARRLEISPQTLALQGGLGGLGAPVAIPEKFRMEMDQFALLPAVERPAAWERLLTLPGNDTETSRLLWCRALIDWVAMDPLMGLPSVPSLVALVANGLPVRPAEINFLLMLSQHLPPTDKTELIGPLLKRILRLRLEAESAAEYTATGAYPYPEWLGACALAELHAADLNRRNAEDLCFANTAADWQAAGEAVDRAQRDYAARIASATAIHDLIGPWHRANAALPGYTEWLARGSTHSVLERFSRELLFQAWRAIWTNSHQVAAAIPGLVANPVPEALSAARDRNGYSSGGMKILESMLKQQVDDLLPTKPESQTLPTARGDVIIKWRTTEDVLSSPLPDGVSAEKRANLVREFRRLSRQLLVTGGTRPEVQPEVAPEATREQAFAAARRRGLLLLDRLRVLDGSVQPTPPVPGFPQQLEFQGEKPETPEYRFNHFAFQADARQSLAEACSKCGELLANATTRAGKTDDMETAERWLRVVPAHAGVTDGTLDRLRRERVQALLLEQARRTYSDHWYGEGGTRYYRTAIEKLARDAQDLGISTPRDLFKPLLESEPPFPVAAETPQRFVLTDLPNPELRIGFTRQPPRGVDGMPVFWATPLVNSESRLAVSLDTRAPLPTLVRPIARLTTPQPRFPLAENAPVNIVGFFRGRTIEKNVPVDIYRVPDRVASTGPRLASTAIAVRADPNIREKLGFGAGAVAVVLDCTGSMAPIDPKHPSAQDRYPRALRALKRLIKDLPPGTILNVWVFGQKMPDAKTPEDTIREVLEPTELPKERSLILNRVMDAVSGLEPWNLSPIVRAALMARDRIQEELVPFKSVILISDGVDSRFDGDQKNIKKRSVKDALRAEFPPSGVSLSLLALPPEKAEMPYQAEFAVVNDLKPAGKFLPIDRVGDLITWLRSGLNPRVRFLLEPLSGQTTSGDLTAGTDTGDNWYTGRLEPGTYQFQIRGAQNFSQSVRLERGDRLLLELTENRGMVEAKRHWFADTAPGVKSGKPSDPWRLTLLQNRSEAGGLKLFATIEDRPMAIDPLSVLRMGDSWFELRPVLPNPGAVSARWRTSPGFPAPSWSIDVPGWPTFPGTPAPASPALEAWWSPGGTFPAKGAWIAPEGKSVLSLKGETAVFGDTRVTLSSVGIEEHVVDGKPQPQKCLVVRVSHPAGDPVWVRPQGAIPAGSEVRVYRGASSVTCLSWGIDATRVTGFDVVVLNDALKRAEQEGRHALLDTIPAPSDASPRPEPPVEPR